MWVRLPHPFTSVFYAFLMTMAREIVKDMEDVRGDRLNGHQPSP